MKKLFCFWTCLFLSACLNAPKDVFTENLNYGEDVQVNVRSVEVVNYQKANDSKHFIEHKWPQTPETIIRAWATKKIKTNPKAEKNLVVAIHQAEVMREKIPAETWYQNNEVKDTLLYQIELLIQKNQETLTEHFVKGQIFAQMPEKSSLATKEKEWVKMANQMLESFVDKGIKQINDQI